ncbi:anti-sigma factor domain-containing protein [Paenibacillus sp. J2TS4]|uniref:anti-sigma factor domain-containing protein n=1 Tax=Paenibacillus sp. J2TS4 TaxID=2807194 RepID=UPI001B1EEC89|nr:anti-sigma factor [Paenibacillus sp. J2TS4]GIP32903.1 hypothetical protein J2TS4_21130 [Paenibacillus sp. J2TS4]
MENNDEKQCITEERIIDLLQGRWGEHAERHSLQHLNTCEACRKLYDEWLTLLSPAGAEQPRSIIKKRIRGKLRWQRFKDIISSISVRKRWGVAMLAAVMTLLLFIGLFRPHSVPWLQDRDLPATLPELRLVTRPGTVLYNVPASAHDLVTGYVWLNSESGEMLIHVEGLPPLPEYDYQVWIVKADDRRNSGILKLTNGKASLYYTAQKNQVREAEGIWLSIEPKGGSLQPSGPDRVLVNLRDDSSVAR